MEHRLRRAVLERLDGLGEAAGHTEPERLLSLARTEIRRLTDGWRQLLLAHQPEDDGRCPRCSGWIRRRRWPCQIWLAAHQHIIGEQLITSSRASARASLRRNRTIVRRRQPVQPTLRLADAELTVPFARIPTAASRH